MGSVVQVRCNHNDKTLQNPPPYDQIVLPIAPSSKHWHAIGEISPFA